MHDNLYEYIWNMDMIEEFEWRQNKKNMYLNSYNITLIYCINNYHLTFEIHG